MRVTTFRLITAFLLAIVIIMPVSAKRQAPDEVTEREKYAESEPVADAPLIATYFYYWYDYPSKAHIVNANGTDALIEHPVHFDGTFSYENDYWFLRELEDMVEAGIDIVLPVYRGHGRYVECEPWSRTGLERMARVLDHMKETGREYPAVGMFYDTETLQYDPDNGFDEQYAADLTTEDGSQTFFLTVKSFFDIIPPEYWALKDGKPIIWLNSSGFAREYDENTFGQLKVLFAEEFGVEPYIVAERSWDGAGEADAVYRWGAALEGSNIGGGVVGVGPGYNDSTVPGSKPKIVDRLESLLYEWGWLTALKAMPDFIVVETWNDLHEGSHICETREQGREYIELTRYFADTFKFPEKVMEEEIEELWELYFNTVTLDPVEVWPIDMARGFVEFPVYIKAENRNLFGRLEWKSGGSDVKIDPGDDNFVLDRGEILRLDYGIDYLEEKTLMGPLPYLSGNFGAGGRDMPITLRLYPLLVRRIDCLPVGQYNEIYIDGDLADWTGKQAVIIADASHVGGPDAPYPMENTGAGYPGWHAADASMEIYTCWDEEYLYMAVATRDDVPLNGQKGKDMLDGDCVQIAFELDDDRDGNIDTTLDFEFSMAEVTGMDRFHTFRRPYGLTGPLDRLIRHAIVRTGNLTVYEFAIPVIEFGIASFDWDEEYTIGFNVVMHDDDGEGWEGFVTLAPGLVYGKDTRRFARIVLVDE